MSGRGLFGTLDLRRPHTQGAVLARGRRGPGCARCGRRGRKDAGFAERSCPAAARPAGTAYGRFFAQAYCDLLTQHADAVLEVARQELIERPLAASPVTGRGGAGPSGRLAPSGRPGSPSNGGGGGLLRDWGLGALVDAASVTAAGLSGALGMGGGGRGGGGGGGDARARGGGGGAPVRLHAKLPSVHWWYNSPSRAAELCTGYNNPHNRDGYLPVMQASAAPWPLQCEQQPPLLRLRAMPARVAFTGMSRPPRVT